MKHPNPFAMFEEHDGKAVNFAFNLDEVTARRYGIKPRVDLRIGSSVRVQDSAWGALAVYWDLPGGGRGEMFDDYHVEEYFTDGQWLADHPGESLIDLLDRVRGKRSAA